MKGNINWEQPGRTERNYNEPVESRKKKIRVKKRNYLKTVKGFGSS
tara:strand:+ start:1842 stop:1979 length:138 start_codon:yes stop_codon:yes gene_type:complete